MSLNILNDETGEQQKDQKGANYAQNQSAAPRSTTLIRIQRNLLQPELLFVWTQIKT